MKKILVEINQNLKDIKKMLVILTQKVPTKEMKIYVEKLKKEIEDN